MDPLIEGLYPLVLYIVYSVLDSCHSVMIMKPPGSILGISSDESIANDPRPIEELFVNVENELGFLKSPNDVLLHCARDLWFLDWFWPFWKKNDYNWDEKFQHDYKQGRNKWWFAKIITSVFLVFIFLIFIARDYKGGILAWLQPVRKVFIQSDNELSFVLLSSITFFFSLGFYKSVGRVFYRLSLHGIQRALVVLSKVNKSFKDMLEVIDIEILKRFDTHGSSLSKISLTSGMMDYFTKNFNKKLDGGEDVAKALPLVMDMINESFPNRVDLDTALSINNIVSKKVNESLMDFYHKFLKLLIIPDIGYSTSIAYDFESFSTSSVIRFVLFDYRGSHFLLLLIIIVFVVSSGFTTATNLIEAYNENEGIDNIDENELVEKKTEIMGILLVVCTFAAIYTCIYFCVLVFLRAIALHFIHKFGCSKTEADGKTPKLGMRSLIACEVTGLYAPSHPYMLPLKVKIGDAFKKVVGDIAFLSFIIPLISFIIISLYMILNEEAPLKNDSANTNNDKHTPGSRPRLQHYIESTKTLTMVCSVIVFAFYFFKVFIKKLS